MAAPLSPPDSIAIIGASGDTETLRGRLTHALIGHGYDGRIFPVTRSQSEVLGLRAYPSVVALPEPVDLAVILVPAAHVVETLEQCGQRGIRAAVVISSGFAEESNEAARARDVELSRIAERHGIVVCGPNSEGIVNPSRPLVATFSPVFHDPSRSLLPAASKGAADRGQLPERGAHLLVSQPRPRQATAFHASGQRRQPDCPGGSRLRRLVARRGQRRHLPPLSRRDPPPGTLPRGCRQGRGCRQAADRRQGRPIGRRATCRSVAHRGAGAVRRYRRCDLPPPRHHPRRGSRPYARCRGRLLVLPVAARQPRRGNHRIGRQRGMDGRYPVGARARTAGAGGRHPEARPRPPPSYASAQNPVDGTAQAIHEVGYARLVEIVRESKRIDTILLIGSLANDATAAKRAEELAAITAATEQPILLSTYTTASPGAMARFAEAGIPCYTSMPSCARAIRALVDYAAFQTAAPSADGGLADPAGSARRSRPRPGSSPAPC